MSFAAHDEPAGALPRARGTDPLPALTRRGRLGIASAIALGALALLIAWGLARVAYWRGTSAGPSPPLPAPYGESFTHHRPWRLSEAAPARPAPASVAALWGGNEVAQSFRACADNLARVRLWLAGPEGTEVFVELRGGRDRAAALYRAHLRLRDADQGRTYSLTFPALPDSEAQMYYLVLWSSAPSVVESATVRTTTGERAGGSFYVNGLPHPGTLDFATYHRGWPGSWTLRAVGESILPRVFRDRLSQYKPPFFKPPAVAVLLGLTATGAVGLLLLLAAWQWRAGRGPGLAGTAVLLAFVAAIASPWVAFPSRDGLPMEARPAEMAVAREGERIYRELTAAMQTATRKPDPRLVTTSFCAGSPCIVVPAESRIGYSTHVPPGSMLRLGFAPAGSTDVELTFEVDVNGETLLLEPARAFEDVTIDLGAYAGQDVRLSLATRPGRGETGGAGLWIAPQLLSTMDWLRPWPLPRPPQHPQGARFGEGIELLGYDLGTTALQPGEAVQITLYWHALQALDTSYTVFVHLLDEAGQIRGQMDGLPVRGAYPTTVWPSDAVVADPHTVPLASDTAPGVVRIAIGIYDLATLQRLPVRDAFDRAAPDARLILEETLGVGSEAWRAAEGRS